LNSLILIDLTLTKIGTFLVIIDKRGEVSHKDIERGRESKRYDVGKGSRKLSTQVGGASS
jgi:hypothetical protein